MPEAPTSLIANAASSSTITLSWADNSQNETEFKIERKATGTYSEIDEVSANTTTYTDFGLTSATQYTYRVAAANDAGVSGYSNEAWATTENCTPETMPVDDADPQIAYTGSWNAQTGWSSRYKGTLHESESAGATASISFDSDAINLYADLRSWGGTASVTIDDLSVGSVNFNGSDADSVLVATFDNLGAGPHDLVMTVGGTGWCYIDYFEYVTCPTPPQPPAAPSNLAATAASGSQIDLTWTDNSDNETNFIVYRDSVEVGTPIVASYSDTGLNPLTTYIYTVAAVNAGGESSAAGPVSETTLGGTIIEDWIDDADASITYTGTWGAQTGWGGRYLTTIHESEDSGTPAAAEMEFTGVEISLIADTQTYAGSIDVYIDDQLELDNVSLNTSTAYQVEIFKLTVANGTHTVKIENQGGGWVYVDAFVVGHY